LHARIAPPTVDVPALELLLDRMSTDEARLLIQFNRFVLEQNERRDAPKEQIFWRTLDLIDSMLVLVDRQTDLAVRLGNGAAAGVRDVRRQLAELRARHEQIRLELEKATKAQDLDRIPQLITAAEDLLADAEALASSANALTQYVEPSGEEAQQGTLRQVDQLLADSQRLQTQDAGGLTPIQIDMDAAMLTALVTRFDLMNERGGLADFWRRIKLAGDDLKSVLNLNASQSIRTRSGYNRPFDFTFEDSQTRLGLSVDTPLNRKSQRNAFRLSLLDYNAALRNLMAAEDDVKLAVRNDLRQLQLDREQYQIAVASAALAYERVISTRLQLQLGVANVLARDFLEAQTAYSASLSAVARQHIGYITDRIQLFRDLELLEVDDGGFWRKLYDEQYQPAPAFQLPGYARPAYGCLPPGVCYSQEVRRMQRVPTGRSRIFRSAPQQQPAPLQAVQPIQPQPAPLQPPQPPEPR
jgi:hypothetical protein